jgi:hypothetical protein
MSIGRSILLFFLAAATVLAAGPVYVHTTGSAIVLGNDYLERTISIADNDLGTRQLLNKLTGGAAPAHVSAWLLTRRVAGGMSFPSGLLPVSSAERATHLLVEETMR